MRMKKIIALLLSAMVLMESIYVIYAEQTGTDVTTSDEPIEIIMPEEISEPAEMEDCMNLATESEKDTESVTAFAASEIIASGTCGAQGDNLTWTLDSNGLITISGTGDMENWNDAEPPPWYSYRTSIRGANIGYGITRIGAYAFHLCINFAAVTISDSVISVGEYAFHQCQELSEVTIPNGVISIEECAFYDCKLQKVRIPNSVTSIAVGAFISCANLNCIEIDNFVGMPKCYGIGNDNTEIVYLRDLNIHPIEAYVKPNRQNAEPPIIITEDKTDGSFSRELIEGTDYTVKYVNNTFLGDTGTAVITYIGDYANYSGNSTEIDFEITSVYGECGAQGDNLTWTFDVDGVLTISGTGDMMDWSSSNVPWSGYRVDAKNVVIGSGVTSIGDYAFYCFNQLPELTVPNNIKSIGNSTFSSCEKLTDVVLPSSVTSIGDSAFYGCQGLQNIQIPQSVTTIGQRVFEKCGSLEITVAEENPNYSSVDGVLFSKDKTILIEYAKDTVQNVYNIPDGVTAIGDKAFLSCTGLTSVTMPDSVTKLGESAFRFCSGLKSLPLGGRIEHISDYAFSNCIGLKTVTIPASVTEIGMNSFASCSQLSSISFPDGLNRIGEKAFYNSRKLLDIVIPNSVTEVGKNAFYNITGKPNITIDHAENVLAGARWGAINGTATYLREISICPIEAQEYRGKLVEPKVTVSEDRTDGTASRELIEGVDYTVSYANNTGVGTAAANLTYIGDFKNYNGVNSVNFEIIAKTEPVLVIQPIPDQFYTGLPVTPIPVIWDLGK